MEYPIQMTGLGVMGVGVGFTAAALASNLQLMKVYPFNASFARISLIPQKWKLYITLVVYRLIMVVHIVIISHVSGSLRVNFIMMHNVIIILL